MDARASLGSDVANTLSAEVAAAARRSIALASELERAQTELRVATEANAVLKEAHANWIVQHGNALRKAGEAAAHSETQREALAAARAEAEDAATAAASPRARLSLGGRPRLLWWPHTRPPLLAVFALSRLHCCSLFLC